MAGPPLPSIFLSELSAADAELGMPKFHHFFIPLPKNDHDHEVHDNKISCAASEIEACNANLKSWAQILNPFIRGIIDMAHA